MHNGFLNLVLKTRLTRFLAITAILIIVAYLALVPLFKYETWPWGHDTTTTIFSAWETIKILRENFHLPFWWQVDDHVFNGNPFMLFYQPFSYLIIFLASLFTSIFDKNYVFSAMKLAVYLSFFISEITMFFLVRSILKDSANKNIISVFASIIYLLAPYRFIDLYSRNAYSELWVFPWMPLYLIGFYKLLFLKERKGWFIISISIPLLFLSHFTPSLFFIFILHIGFFVTLLLTRNLKSYIKQNVKVISSWFLSHLIGFALSSVYIIPAMSNMKYCIGNVSGFDRVNLNHILEHISWGYFMLDPTNFTEKWQVGSLFLIAFILSNIFILKRKTSKYRDLILFLNVSVFITLIFLLSETLWKHLPEKLYTLQFTWRLFLVYTILCSVIIAILANEFRLKIPVLLLLLVFHFYTGQRFLYYGGDDMVKRYFNVESWINKFYREDYTTANGGISHGFLPKTSLPQLFNFESTNKLKANEKFPNTFIFNQNPLIEIISSQRKGNTFSYELKLDKKSFIVFKQYFYPTWQIFVDSKKQQEIYLTDNGYVGFKVPGGKHIVKLKII